MLYYFWNASVVIYSNDTVVIYIYIFFQLSVENQNATVFCHKVLQWEKVYDWDMTMTVMVI